MTLALDGSDVQNGNSTTSVVFTLSTTNTNDIIYVCVKYNTTVPTISDTAGLTWTTRQSQTSDDVITFYAVSAAALSSNTITVTGSASIDLCGVAFGISGADTSTKFDSNASIPAVNTNDTSATSLYNTISTSNADDFIINIVYTQQNVTNTPSIGSLTVTTIGKAVDTSNSVALAVYYAVASATQSSISVGASFSTAVTSGCTVLTDAVIAGTATAYKSLLLAC